MIGKTISHYKILEKLGEGGMGVVYKAEDTKLKRTVALKFLTPYALGSEEEKTRFVLEAQAAAALDHPNICTVHEIDEAEGKTFIAMAYIAGQSLKEKIKSEPLKLDEALDIAKQVAEGLQEAHEKGIVHRDIKSANIMMTEKGQAKIMDFGLAKLAEGTKLTKTATIMGTVAYMSPEQARGEVVDHRTDIWSLGLVLYEMVTGQLPFKGEYEQGVVYSILHEEPQPLTSLRSQIPTELERVVSKAMAKSIDERYQHVGEVILDLRALRKELASKALKEQASATKAVPSIAVLPFINMSADKEQEYFCDGMAEELINALSKVKELRVVARTSAFSFKGKEIDIREIGNKLNVETVLEGSVRKAGNRLRITAQLVNAADGYHLWSERFDRQMEDVFAIQDEISLAIVDKLKLKLMGKEKAAIVRRYTDNLEAYNLYLQGRFYCSKLTPEGAEKGIECFEAAIESDPTYALAYAGLAYLHGTRAVWGSIPPNKELPIARKYAEKALEIDDTVAEAHGVLGDICFMYDWNWVGAEQEYKRALELDPTIAQTYVDYSLFLLTQKRDKEAVAEARLAQKFDPLSTMINGWVGHVLFLAGQYEEGIEQLNKVLKMDPSYWNSHLMMSFIYRERAMLQEAMAEAEKAVDFSGSAPIAVMNLASVCYLLGKRARAEKLFDSLKERSQSEYIPPMFFVLLHLARGEVDEAYKWLEKAYENHDIWLCFYRYFPSTPTHDPRFTALLKKIGLE